MLKKQQNIPLDLVDKINGLFLHGMKTPLQSMNLPDNQYTVAQVIEAVDSQLDAVARAFGGCTKCYGKGYASELTSTTVSADFISDKTVRVPRSNMVLCTCSRGQQLEKILEYLKGSYANDSKN